MDNSKAGSGSEPEIIERSRAYWSQRAKEYSALHDASRHQELRDAFRKLLRGFMPRDKGPHGQRRTRALDVGSGSGLKGLLIKLWTIYVMLINNMVKNMSILLLKMLIMVINQI